MENIQNKEGKGNGSGMEGHPNSCHCMLCSMRCGGWHGHHSLVRVAIAIAVLFITFCFGVHVGEWKAYDRGGWGHGHFERHMRGNVMYYGGEQYGGQPNMMFDRQVIMKTGGAPVLATGTMMMKQ